MEPFFIVLSLAAGAVLTVQAAPMPSLPKRSARP